MDAAITFLEHVFGPFGPGDHIERSAVREAEERLGVGFPRALADYYCRTGASRPLHFAHNQLVPLARVDFADDHLVFYEENQSVVVWGIHRARLAEIDPPVEQGQEHDGAWRFYPELESVSQFACAQGAWQAVQGGLPFVGVLDAPSVPDLIARAELGSPAVAAPDLRAWSVEQGVVTCAGAEHLGLATRDAEAFRRASQRLGLDIEAWDYATLRDET